MLASKMSRRAALLRHDGQACDRANRAFTCDDKARHANDQEDDGQGTTTCLLSTTDYCTVLSSANVLFFLSLSSLLLISPPELRLLESSQAPATCIPRQSSPTKACS